MAVDICSVITERIIILCVGFILDLIFGELDFLTHPVVYIGRLITCIDNLCHKTNDYRNKKRELFLGAYLTLIVVTVSVAVPSILLIIIKKIYYPFAVAFKCYLCYRLLATKSLYTESMKVYYGLKSGDIEKGRKAVAMIVGRDTNSLNETGIIKACVETIAENTSDGIVAPLIFIALFGIQGGFLYKAVNTLDSMVGYKNDKYLHFGRVSARTDDLLNYIPARISGLIMASFSFIVGLDSRNAIRIYFRDRKKHESPNSAHCEAAMAGALNVELAGDAWYFGVLHKKDTIGDSVRNIEVNDIKRANNIMLVTSVVTLVLIISLLGILENVI